MSIKANPADRRKFRRFKTVDKVFASLGGSGYQRKLAEIINIGNGGISFRYLNYDKQTAGEVSSDTNIEIDLFLPGDNCFLGQVPVETVSDSVISKIAGSDFMALRQCQIKFKELSPYQIFQLEKFIHNRLHSYLI